jgi:DNA ligase-1
LPVSNQFEISDNDDVEELFQRALNHGNEGLMLKKKKSTYEYGQRRKSWLKVKKPGGSFDTVIMYAHAGSGKRGGTYSDFTLGISVKEDERYEEEFIPIGKAYGGYTDEELKKMNRKVKELTVERYGPTLGLLPELVVEIEFDDIQVNKRTKAGYTLRLPRFKSIRWDLGPSDVNTLQDVERLYRKKLENEPLSQNENPSFSFSTSGNQG